MTFVKLHFTTEMSNFNEIWNPQRVLLRLALSELFWFSAGRRKLLLGDDEVRNEHNLKISRQMPKSISPPD
jgi:hypothetical protein